MSETAAQRLASLNPAAQKVRGLLSVVRGAFARLPTFVILYLVCALVPTTLSGVYWGLIASDVYVAEARFAIRSAGSASSGGFLDQVLGSSAPGNAAEDAEIVRDYIHSRDMLAVLDERLNLSKHFGSKVADWFSRLEFDASAEDDLEYYRGMIVIRIDESSHITTIKARAFSPEVAQRLAAAILEASEQLVNRMSATVAADTLAFARKELAEAEDRIRAATVTLTAYRTQSRSVDPGQETSAVLGIVTQLEGLLARARAELAEVRSFMRLNSARVQNLTARVEALEAQVERERARMASDVGGDLNNVILGYEPLALDQKLAEQQYASALASLEGARAEAQRKQRYLIAFVKPTLPDEAIEPERLWNTLTILLASSIGFGIFSLLWSAVREHARL